MANTIVPPGIRFTDGLVQKYLNKAPAEFQTHKAPKVMDFTQTLGDGVTSYEKEDRRRGIQVLSLANPNINQLMSEQAAKRISFYKNIDTSYIDMKKLDVIESTKVKVSEADDRILQRSTVHMEGKLYVDVIPVATQ